MAPVLDVVVPVHNEETDLEPCLRRLHAHLTRPSRTLPHHRRGQRQHRRARPRSPPGSPPSSPDVERRSVLDREGPGPRAAHRRGSRSDAAVLAYMDVDLSTDLAALLPLVAPLISGHSDLAIGTRLAARPRAWCAAPKREVISRGYNLLLRRTLADSLPTRSAGSRPSGRRRPAAAAAGRGHRLVLRHRAAGARRARRACASTRCRSTGSTTPTAAVDIVAHRPRRPGRHRAHAARARHRRGCRWPAAGPDRPTPARPRPCPGARRAWSASSSRFAVGRRAVHPRLPGALRAAPRRGRRPGRPTLRALLLTAVANTAANRRLTFGVRGGDRRRAPPAAGPGRVRPRAWR